MSRPIFFAFFVVMLDAMGAGLIYPVLPALLAHIFDVDPDGTLVKTSGGVLFLVFAVLMFLFGPIMGSLSDRFGRQRVIFLAMLAMAVDYTLMALFPLFWVLLIGRIIVGVAGGSYTSAFAIVGDVSSDGDRGRNFGIVSSGLGLGFVIGPLIGGWVGGINLVLPFWIAVGLTATAAILSLSLYQETLPPAARRAFSLAKSNAFSVFVRMRANPRIAAFLAALLVFSCGETVYETIWNFYGTTAFGWTTRDIGNTLVAFGLGMALVQGGLSGPLINRFGAIPVAMGAMALSCLGLAVMIFAWATWVIYALMPLMWVSGLSLPAIQTYLSERTDDSHQGELQGVLASLGSIALIVAGAYGYGSLIFATLENGPIFLPGAPFAIALILCGVAWFLLYRAGRAGGEAKQPKA